MNDKTKMIYNDDNTIGVDESSLNQLMNILTPRMQKQLVDELHNNKPEHGDFKMEGNTLWL